MTFLGRAETCRYVTHIEIHKHIRDYQLLFLHSEIYHCKCPGAYFKKRKESVMFNASQVTQPSVWTCRTVKQIYKTRANSYFRPYWKNNRAFKLHKLQRLYAAGQILMATSEDDLQTMAHHLNIIARKYKMTISSTKTKSMTMWGEPHTEGKNCGKRQYYWTSNRF